MAVTTHDPRITRTRRLLQSALLQLARERPLDAITVADIADRAEVNRSTFYQHYSDKDTLLADALDAQVAAAGADLESIAGAFTPGAPAPELLLRYVTQVGEHADLYRRVLVEHGSPIAVTRLRRRITAVAVDGIAMYGPETSSSGLPVEIAAASVAGSLIGMLIAWLESPDPVEPRVITAWIWGVLNQSGC